MVVTADEGGFRRAAAGRSAPLCSVQRDGTIVGRVPAPGDRAALARRLAKAARR
jgi:hypothetical protein